MTDNDNKYNKSYIYKIVDKGYNECYYGSTITRLSQRLSGHKSLYNKYKDGKAQFLTSFILFDKYGIDNCKIELVENYSCNSKTELNRREGYWIENNNCVNKIFNYDNRNKNNEKKFYDNIQQDKMKKYYEKNKEYLREKINCDCGSIVSRQELLKHQKTQKHINRMCINL